MKRERVLAALRHQATDIVPFNTEPTLEMTEKLCACLQMDAAEVLEWTGNHIEKFNCKEPDVECATGFYRDEYGVVWNRTVDKDIGMPKPVLTEPDLTGWQPPEINFGSLHTRLDAFVNNGRDSYKFAKIDFVLFERAWSLRGFENLLTDFLLEPDFVRELLTQITDRNMRIIEASLRHDIDGIYIGDDYGQQTGMLFSPETWREFIKPQLKRMFNLVKAAGKTVCLHSCGNIWPILGDLADIGLDIYQTVQPEIYDLTALKKEFGNALCFYGGISTQRDLPVCSPEDIRRIVRETIAVLGRGGGYIAAPTHRVPCDVPPENLAAMVDTFKNQ